MGIKAPISICTGKRLKLTCPNENNKALASRLLKIASRQPNILTGLDLHILGITAATLILGWRLAILSSLLASALLFSFGQVSFNLLPVQILIGAFIPILLSYLSFVVCYHYLPKHFFVYIFVCAFITAGFIACIKISLGALFYFSLGQYNWQELADNYVYLSAIIWFPEAMLNGMAITILITYRPHWVKTFYDKDYLDS
jgi:uncharacterized membrane protein